MNATYLFQMPYREFHNSESWWSSFFSFVVLQEAQSVHPRSLPVWRYSQGNRFWREGQISTAGLKLSHVVVEGALCGLPFSCRDWPQEYLALKIDVALIGDQHVRFVETKTIGASIANKLSLYRKLTNHLRAQGWEADLYHLISYGHEDSRDWRFISEEHLPLLLWEDVLRLVSETPLGRILGVELQEFAELPEDVGNPY